MDFALRSRILEFTEEELRSEMAIALGRIGATLEKMIGELHALKQDLSLGNDASKADKFRGLQQQAKLYYWYLIVQRESIGLRSHADVATHYAIPDLQE